MGNICSCEEGTCCFQLFSPCIMCCIGCKQGCQHCSEGCESCKQCLFNCCQSINNGCSKCCGVCGCSCLPLTVCCSCECENPFLIRDQSNPELSQVLSEFINRGEFQDRWFGNVKLMEHKMTKELIILKETSNIFETDFRAQYQQFQQRSNLKNQNIVQMRCLIIIYDQIIDVTSRQEDTFCASIYKSYLFFDYILTDLRQECMKRSQKDQLFTETEIFTMIDGCLKGLSYLADQKIPHGSIRLSNIYITPSGIYKVADPALFNYSFDYEKIQSNHEKYGKFIFLSPELMHAFEKKIDKPAIDVVKSDIFTLGMVLLQVCSSFDSTECYNYEQCLIFEDKIKNNLQVVKVRYHDAIFFLIQDMLTFVESQRPSYQQLMDKLSRVPKARQANNFLTETVISPKEQGADRLDIQKDTQPIVSIYANKIPDQTIYKPDDTLANKYDQYGGTHDYQTGGGLDLMPGGGGIGNDFLSTPFVSDYSWLDNSNTKEKAELKEVKEKYPNGCKYIGQKKNNQRQGKGKFVYQDGSYYNGEWKNNEMNGRGALFDAKKKVIYDGQWLNGKYHGHGTEYNPNNNEVPMIYDVKLNDLSSVDQYWSKYEGSFKNDKWEGFGTLILQNGDKFVGGFKDGMINGHGTYYRNGKDPVEGLWVNGITQNAAKKK